MAPGVKRAFKYRFVRHEALFYRVEVKDLHHWAVAAARKKLGAA
jgi:hypothetical protein